jgi:hypothetical protein
MQQRKTRIGLGLLTAALVGVGCQDLQVTNPNNPDRDRAISNPADVENLIAGTYATLWNPLHDYASAALLWSAWGREGTTTSQVGAIWVSATQEPAQAISNDSNQNPSTGLIGPPQAWLDFHRVASNANDGLAAIAGETGSQMSELTRARARAVALLNRGLAWGYLAMGWDQATILFEDTDLGSDANAVVKANIRPYPEVLQAALASIDEAIAVANATPFTVPASWYRTAGDFSSAELIRVANSYKAKFLVYTARTPEERAAVDWNQVLQLTSNGVTQDWGTLVTPEAGGLTTDYIRQLQLNSRNGLQQSRADYETIGPADVSGTWQTYINTPLEQRQKILITTPDRRVTGPTPESDGTYFRFMSPALVGTLATEGSTWGFLADRGLYNFSAYQWYRYGGGFTNIFVPMMGVTENRLIRAEALLRTGDAEGAAALINVSRTAPQTIGTTQYPGLPAVTAAGVPQGESCVPRTRGGACGDLLEALIYERRIELYGVDGMRSWADNRGFGRLREGNPIHMPVPGRELEALGLPQYTYGGVGGNCAFGAACAPAFVNP